MPLTLPAEIIASKNKLYSGKTLYDLLEIRNTYSKEIIRIVNNNEDVKWKYHWWTKFKFGKGDETETADGDNHDLVVKVSNNTGVMQGYVEADPNGMIDDIVIYRYVDPEVETPAIEDWFQIVDAQAVTLSDGDWVLFTLGAENWFLSRFPAHVYRRNICRYQPHLTDICPYTNSVSCNRRFDTCISLGRAGSFGGQPGIPGGSFDV